MSPPQLPAPLPVAQLPAHQHSRALRVSWPLARASLPSWPPPVPFSCCKYRPPNPTDLFFTHLPKYSYSDYHIPYLSLRHIDHRSSITHCLPNLSAIERNPHTDILSPQQIGKTRTEPHNAVMKENSYPHHQSSVNFPGGICRHHLTLFLLVVYLFQKSWKLGERQSVRRGGLKAGLDWKFDGIWISIMRKGAGSSSRGGSEREETLSFISSK